MIEKISRSHRKATLFSPSKNETIDTKRKIISTSLTETCTRVCAKFPFVSLLYKNTMGVQGATPNSTAPVI